MFTLQGKYSSASVYAETIDQAAIAQIIAFCNQEFTSDSKICIMPDVHAGKDCVVGLSMTIKDKVVPDLVGSDIGCGMLCIRFGQDMEIDMPKFDEVVRLATTSECRHRLSKDVEESLHKLRFVQDRSAWDGALYSAQSQFGTVGGGNHFVELDKDSYGYFYLVIHSGSRNLGAQVCSYYRKAAYKELSSNREAIQEIITQYKAEGRQKEIQPTILALKGQSSVPATSYVKGQLLDDYLNDMVIVQKYAFANRMVMAAELIQYLATTCPNFQVQKVFQTIHNYIDVEHMILRKGAISAQLGEELIIPINMRDGSLICIGNGNPDWNYSAPHGAGRVLSRSAAKAHLSMDEFKKSMEGVFTTSVNESTLDEAAMAYKTEDEIKRAIAPTANVVDVIRPIYNFKVSLKPSPH